MKTYITILLFFLCNIIGFLIGSVLYAIALTKFIDIESSGINLESIRFDMGIVLLIWITCALFSFSSFFLSKNWKILFLLAPIIMPLLTSLVFMFSYT